MFSPFPLFPQFRVIRIPQHGSLDIENHFNTFTPERTVQIEEVVDDEPQIEAKRNHSNAKMQQKQQSKEWEELIPELIGAPLSQVYEAFLCIYKPLK